MRKDVSWWILFGMVVAVLALTLVALAVAIWAMFPPPWTGLVCAVQSCCPRWIGG